MAYDLVLQRLLDQLVTKLGRECLPDYIILGQRESLRLWQALKETCVVKADAQRFGSPDTQLNYGDKAIRIVAVPMASFLEFGWNDLAGKGLFAEMRRRAAPWVWEERADG